MQKQTFYRRDTLGNTRIWEIEVEKVSDAFAIIHTYDGIEGGKMKGSDTPISTGLNLGKANETTVYEQACKDAQSVIDKQIKKGYGSDKNNLKGKGETATINAPMKGETYHPTGIYKDGSIKKGCFTLDGPIRLTLKPGKEKTASCNIKNFIVESEGVVLAEDGTIKKDNTIRGKWVFVDRKLDGYRYRVHVNHDGTTFYSSSGDKVIPFPHIAKSIHDSFLKIEKYVFDEYGITEYYLDGEIYRHQFDETGKPDEFGGFQATSSACGTQKNLDKFKEEFLKKGIKITGEQLRAKMQFHLFDVCLLDCPYTTRLKVLKNFYDGVNVLRVEKFKIIAEEKAIESLMEQFLNEGYEGLMIKTLEMPYEFKRSKQMLKYKPIIDEEYQIVGFKESITGGTLGSIKCVMDDGSIIWANPMNDLGTDEMKQKIWDNQKDYLGKWVTCIFLNYTDDGLPRHPRAKCFRKGKSKD